MWVVKTRTKLNEMFTFYEIIVFQLRKMDRNALCRRRKMEKVNSDWRNKIFDSGRFVRYIAGSLLTGFASCAYEMQYYMYITVYMIRFSIDCSHAFRKLCEILNVGPSIKISHTILKNELQFKLHREWLRYIEAGAFLTLWEAN